MSRRPSSTPARFRFPSWLGVELVEISAKERLVAALGGGLSMLCLLGLSSWVFPQGGAEAFVASMGASAVLLFALPHGQLSQPWPVLAGHGVSALLGVATAQWLGPTVVAAAVAVGAAIAAMHLFKCVHPPGGATALTAVLGGEAVRSLGWSFVAMPVLANGAVMVLLAVAINRSFPWRRYPAPTRRAAAESVQPSHEQVLCALRSMDALVDVSEADLIHLSRLLQASTERRKAASEPRLPL